MDINEIYLDPHQFNNYNLETDRVLSNLSKINIFIGPNNCGKSRFMRQLYSTEKLSFNLKSKDVKELHQIFLLFKKDLKELFSAYKNSDFDTLLSSFNSVQLPKWFIEGSNPFEAFINYAQSFVTEDYHFDLKKMDDIEIDVMELQNNVRELVKNRLEQIKSFANPGSTKIQKIYIPTLRGLRPFSGIKNDPYFDRTKRDYIRPENKCEIFTGLNLYDDIKHLRNSNNRDRRILNNFEKFLSTYFFDSKEIEIVPQDGQDVLTIKIGDEKEQPIYNLGDGVQSIIILTFPLFKYQSAGAILFIEEPENFMHPGLQRKLVEVYLSDRAKNFQVIFTTHSNHLLDLSIDYQDISIYSFVKKLSKDNSDEKTPEFFINTLTYGDKNILDLIGARNSSVFLSNATIWVEGITDRLYIRKFLKVYFESNNITFFKEDLHYSFLEYGGNNITHWSFFDKSSNDELFTNINVERLCGKLFLITDFDNDSKIERHIELKDSLGKRYYCLDVKEIENLLTPKVIKEVISEYERRPASELEFITELDFNKYKDKYLGTYIEKNLKNKTRPGKYDANSGSVSDKVNFCRKAISHINSIEDLSTSAIKLCDRIYKFIKKQNLIE